MRKSQDLIGKVFGRLTVIANAEKRGGLKRCVCRCECGKLTEVYSVSLTRRNRPTRSCNCIRVNGRSYHPAYSSWCAMLNRCYNPGIPKFRNYGARGIHVCQSWRDDFFNFANDMGERPPGTTLERIDVNGNYEPGNCMWADPIQQARNRRNSRFVEYNGVKMMISDLSAITGINHGTIRHWSLKGYNVQQRVEKFIKDHSLGGPIWPTHSHL